MTDDRDETLDELRAAMAIEPSPEFEARVRVATRESRRAGTAWGEHRRAWMWSAVAAGAVAVAVIAVVLLRPGNAAAPSAVATMRPSLTPDSAASLEHAPASGAAARPRASMVVVSRRPARAQPVDRRARVIVPDGQTSAFAQFVNAAARGEIRLQSAGASSSDAEEIVPALTRPKPIEIAQIVIARLEVDQVEN